MPTTNQTFWPDPDYAAHDQAYGSDIDKMLLSAPASGNGTSTQNFDTGGNTDIRVDPNSAAVRADGITNLDQYGWTIDNADMGSTATEKRRIVSGTWTFTGTVAASAAALNNVGVRARVYRVAASPSFTRTQLGSTMSVNAGLVAVNGTDWSGTITDIGEVILEAGETIQVSFYVNATGQPGGLQTMFRVGVTNLHETTRIQMPAAIATRYIRSHSVTASTAIAVGNLLIKKAFAVTAATSVAAARVLRLARSFSVTASTSVATVKKTLKSFSVTASTAASGLVQMGLDVLNRITGGGSSNAASTGGLLWRRNPLPPFQQPPPVAKQPRKEKIQFVDATPTVKHYTVEEIQVLLDMLDEDDD